MRIRNLIGPVLGLAVLALAGCGGGDSAPAPSAGLNSTVISGLASKGPIDTGTVKVYAISNGVVETTPLNQGNTDASGNYSIDCGSHKGPVLVEVTGGTYKDEVSGKTVSLTTPLRTVVSDTTTGKNTVAVTPLTDLATSKAKGSGSLTAASIDDANKSIAATFSLADIVVTQPVSGSSNAGEGKYAAACGSFSQLANNEATNSGKSLDDALKSVMSSMESEMEHSGNLSDDSITKITTAATEFNSGKNSGGTLAPVVNPTKGSLVLSTTGNENIIGAIDLTVQLPAGVTVSADPASGEVTGGAVAISGVAAAGTKLVIAKYTAASGSAPGKLVISLLNANGFGLGEFLTINFNMAAGATFPAKANAFSVTSFVAKGLAGAILSGVSAAPTSLTGL